MYYLLNCLIFCDKLFKKEQYCRKPVRAMKTAALNNEEHILKCIYENHITLDNYREKEALLRSYFPDEKSYLSFIESYLTKFTSLCMEDFMRANQRLDAFSHPRFSQQETHIHNFFEIKYQMKGTGTVIVDNKTIFLRESDFCFIAPFVGHCSEIFDPDSYMINLVVVPQYIAQVFPRVLQYHNFIEEFLYSSQKDNANHTFMHIHTNFDPEIENLVTDIFQYFRKNKSFTLIGDLNAEAALERIFLLLLQKHMLQSGAFQSHTKQDEQIDQMVDYIQEHLDSVTFSDIARLFHYSPSYTSRFIQKHTGQNFTNILKILRLKKAAELLKSSELTIDQITEQVGYSGKTNFYNSFKNYYGVTPAEFRKNAAGSAHSTDYRP